MTEAKKKMALWVKTWKEAAEKLEEIRLSELSDLETPKALQAFFGLVEDLNAKLPPRISSGLVEQQRLFQQLRKQ